MIESRLLFLFSIFFVAAGCNSKPKSNTPVAIHDALPDTANKEKQTFEILVDSIYNNKNYKIVLEYYPNGIGIDSSSTNTVFTFLDLNNRVVLFKDTVYSRTGNIEFKDFNGDFVKDILIQNISDVRSNWTYNLYLVDTTHDRLTKVNGFNVIKNPNYLPQHDLVDNLVNSGTNWTGFYQIQGDSVKDLDIVIYEDVNDEDKYEKEYNKAIARIVGSKHNR